MKTAAGAGSEFLLVGPVALNIGQPGNAVALQTPRHCGTAEMLARRKGNHPAATADADGKQRRSLRPQGGTGCEGRSIPMDRLDQLVTKHLEDAAASAGAAGNHPRQRARPPPGARRAPPHRVARPARHPRQIPNATAMPP